MFLNFLLAKKGLNHHETLVVFRLFFLRKLGQRAYLCFPTVQCASASSEKVTLFPRNGASHMDRPDWDEEPLSENSAPLLRHPPAWSSPNAVPQCRISTKLAQKLAPLRMEAMALTMASPKDFNPARLFLLPEDFEQQACPDQARLRPWMS